MSCASGSSVFYIVPSSFGNSYYFRFVLLFSTVLDIVEILLLKLRVFLDFRISALFKKKLSQNFCSYLRKDYSETICLNISEQFKNGDTSLLYN